MDSQGKTKYQYPKKTRKRRHLYVNLAHSPTKLCVLVSKMHLQDFQEFLAKHFKITSIKKGKYISTIGQSTPC